MKLPEGFDQSNQEQMLALKCLEQTRESLFLTGSAGTGKSYFLNLYCNTTKKNFVKLAPTGLAALNIHGQTIHSFFKLPRTPLVDPNHIPSIVRRFRKDLRATIRHLDLIVIDEISMVRCDTLDAVDAILRRVRNNDKPFGGIQLLMVGDPFQLPPVTPMHEAAELQQGYPDSSGFYFFDARAYHALNPRSVLLRHIYRQSDQEFISALEEIRMGQVSDAAVRLLNGTVSPGWDEDLLKSYDHEVLLLSHRADVDQYNEYRCSQVAGREYSFEGRLSGTIPSSSLPVPMEVNLKEGIQVMLVSNHSDGLWVNGTTGTIEEIISEHHGASADDPSVVIKTSDNEYILVTPQTWTQIEYRYDAQKKEIVEQQVGSYTQLPIIIAYAITVHKAQGQTCDKIVVDPSRFFAPGQGYVALSRCRTLAGLTLTQPLKPNNLKAAPSVVRFYRSILPDYNA